MALGSISEENPAAMAASCSIKVSSNLCCFSTSLLLLPPLLPLLLTLMLNCYKIWSACVSQVFAVTVRKPNHDYHWMLVSTAFTAFVLGIVMYQLYFIILMPHVAAYLILPLQSSRKYECLSPLDIITFSALLPCFLHC